MSEAPTIKEMSDILGCYVHDSGFGEMLNDATVAVIGRELRDDENGDDEYWSTLSIITMKVLNHLSCEQAYYKALDG